MSSRLVNTACYPPASPRPLLSVSMTLEASRCCPTTASRCDASIGGGTFESSDHTFKGRILPRHGCFFLERPDSGLGELEMRYVLQTDHGENIDVEFHGILLLTPVGRWLHQQGVYPPPESECRCTGHHRLANVPLRFHRFDQSLMVSEITFPKQNQLQISCYASDYEPMNAWPDLDQWVNEPCLDWLPSSHDPSSRQ